MSVHVIDRAKSDAAHEVRWRTLAGTNASLRFDSESDAAAFDEAVRAAVALKRANERWAAVSTPMREFLDQHPEFT